VDIEELCAGTMGEERLGDWCRDFDESEVVVDFGALRASKMGSYSYIETSEYASKQKWRGRKTQLAIRRIILDESSRSSEI